MTTAGSSRDRSNRIRTIFLSSTSRDLQKHRDCARQALAGLDADYHCVAMEDFGARNSGADSFCRRQAAECDLFIGIIGQLYGGHPEGSEQSFTEREYDAALAAGKPMLMFLTADDVVVPAALHEPEERRTRQETFRARVNTRFIRATFRTPDDLATKIVIAVRNWEKEHAAGQSRAGARKPGGRSHYGPMVPRSCDREPQEQGFLRFFWENVRQQTPQLYLLRGDVRECADSLVSRLYETHLKPHVERIAGPKRATAATFDVEWPEYGTLKARLRDLQLALFRSVDPCYEIDSSEFSADALCQLVESQRLRLALIHHRIPAATWDGDTTALLRTYLQFWTGLKRSPRPQFVVMLDVRYPNYFGARESRAAAVLNKLFLLPTRRRVKAAFHALESTSGCFVAPLEELTCVKQDHVVQWFRKHGIYDSEKEQYEAAQRLFQSADGRIARCRNMVDIEHALSRIHREFANQEGPVT